MIIDNTNYTNKLLFIIEEGQFNLGNFDKAIQMIELAAKTGANGIEFQLAYADDFYIRSDAGYNTYKTREFSDEQLSRLIATTRDFGMHFIATCLSHKLVEKMAKFGTSGFNINASDINNPSIVEAVTATQLPFFVSMPLATSKEIDWVISKIDKLNPTASFALLHGQHPMASGKEFVELEDTALGFIQTAKEKYQRNVGFIDHTPLLWMPSIAVAAGAQIITKHMTASHVFNGPDHGICLDPKEMKEAIAFAKQTYASKHVTTKELAKGEDLDRSVMRRSIVAARKISKGDILTYSDIVFKRPGSGIPPDMTDSILGKKVLRDIEEDTLLTAEMIAK